MATFMAIQAGTWELHQYKWRFNYNTYDNNDLES